MHPILVADDVESLYIHTTPIVFTSSAHLESPAPNDVVEAAWGTQWEDSVEIEAETDTDTDSQTHSEGEKSTAEQESATDYDSLTDSETDGDGATNSEWESLTEEEVAANRAACFAEYGATEQDAEGGWQCQTADFLHTADLSRTDHDSPEAAKYRELAFRKTHYFLVFVQRVLEETCLRYARQQFAAQLCDNEWKRQNFPLLYSEDVREELLRAKWLEEDKNELLSWMQLFSASFVKAPEEWPNLNKLAILNCVAHLRNAAVHRGVVHEGCELTNERLQHAMELPMLLGDAKAGKEISDAYRCVMEDPMLDEQARATAEAAMMTPPPCTSRYRLLGRIQTLLEETCFNNASRNIPDALKRRGWDVPERVELQHCRDLFQSRRIQSDDSINELFPHDTLSELLWDARIGIRNKVAHRILVTDEQVIQEVHRAIRICILQSDWHQAIEIEVVAEMYFTRHSRGCVLKRLGSVYLDGECESAYEWDRRWAIESFLATEEAREGSRSEELDAEDAEDEDEEDDNGRGIWVKGSWSPSMHRCLKRLVGL